MKLSLIFGFFVVVLDAVAASECTACDACPAANRTECGYFGVTQSICEADKCLWCPLEDGESGPWCTVNTALEATEQCVAQDDAREECGFFGISGTLCEIQGCCWYPTTTDNVPWCYHSATSNKCSSCEACPLTAKTDCGYFGISEDECTSNRCLWCPLVDSELGPWCVVDTSLNVTDVCQIEDAGKSDCGYIGITASACENSGCCWHPTSADDVPWCYHSTVADECTSCGACPDSAKTDCGYWNITQEECEANQCLWCPLEDREGPWCVVDTALEVSEQCTVNDEDKIDCGEVGTDKEECEESNCCWKPSSSEGTPWCYNSATSGPK